MSTTVMHSQRENIVGLLPASGPKLKMKVHKIHNSLVTSWVHLGSSLWTIGYKLVVANAIMKMYSIAVAMLDVILPLKDCINGNRLNF